MLPDASVIRKYFAKLGLEPEIADIYLALHAYGSQSIAVLARNSKVERTRIYRLIPTLLESNLIEVETRANRGIMKAAPITNLNILINQREQELKNLQDELGLIEQVLARNSLSNPTTRVQFYYGSAGIKQVLATISHTPSEVLRLHRTRPALEITLNHKVLTNAKVMPSTTSRYIPPERFTIHQDWILYKDTLVMFSQKDQEQFAVEIQNKETATMQRQLFSLLWEQNRPTLQE